MKISKDLIHTPKSEDGVVCIVCNHPCHCGGTCDDKGCHCGRCVHNEEELVEGDINN